jgi:hypothetical protein
MSDLKGLRIQNELGVRFSRYSCQIRQRILRKKSASNLKEWQADYRRERKRAAEEQKATRRKFGKARKQSQLTDK